jgi:hypothetical protein
MRWSERRHGRREWKLDDYGYVNSKRGSSQLNRPFHVLYTQLSLLNPPDRLSEPFTGLSEMSASAAFLFIAGLLEDLGWDFDTAWIFILVGSLRLLII